LLAADARIWYLERTKERDKSMKTIEMEIEITGSGEINVPVPSGIRPGKHAVLVIVDERECEPTPSRLMVDFPVDSVGTWPSGLSLRREDLYGDRGR
jgi:hypothetical protein